MNSYSNINPDHPSLHRLFPGPTTALLLLFLSCILSSLGAAPPDYHGDITPILRDYCAGCHNNDDLEGELSVETFAQLIKGGEHGATLVPGNATNSLLFQMLTGANEKKRMPPKREPQLSPQQISLIQTWINNGATGPQPNQDLSLLSTLLVPHVNPATHWKEPATAISYRSDSLGNAIAFHKKVVLQYTTPNNNTHLPSAPATTQILPHPGKVNAVHFSHDNQSLITASGIPGLNGIALLWKNGKLIRTFENQHRDILYDAELSPDGTLLATAGYDRKIVLWNSDTAEVLRTIDGHNGAIFDLSFHPDGNILASASADETVKLWRVSDGLRLDTLNQPQGEQFAVQFTPDGKHIIAAGADNRIRLWQLTSLNHPQINPLIHARFGHENDITNLALSRNGKWLVSSSDDLTVKLWSVPDLVPSRVWNNQPDTVTALAILPDDQTVSVFRMDGSHQDWPLQPDKSAAVTPPATVSVLNESSSETAALTEQTETEPNQDPSQANPIQLPAEIKGVINEPGDSDLFRFHATAGEEWVLEINAARNKSDLDSVIEVLDADGNPIEQVVLQALRDSWFTFRGKNSVTSDDFRIQNWREMELNEYLYANGEVVKLWLYPRGPDSGFKVYPGFGKRYTYFNTTALSHPLGEPCYVVQAFPPGSNPSPNGLPVFRLNYSNDDDPRRRWGTDSQLFFTAPADGHYLARVTDVRGDGGAKFQYTLNIRPRQPDFRVTLEGNNPAVSPGSGREFTLTADRRDGFDGAIEVHLSNLPPGFSAPSPIVIEAGQEKALGLIFADLDAQAPAADLKDKSKLTATALIQGKERVHDVGTLGEIKLAAPAKILVEILPDDPSAALPTDNAPLEFSLAPGETITARVRATRVDFKNRIELGGDDSGRNLPHGVYVDNIGLNGLLIVEGETERQFYITAAKWVPETTRFFYLRATADGGQTSRPALLHIRPKSIAKNQ